MTKYSAGNNNDCENKLVANESIDVQTVAEAAEGWNANQITNKSHC